jgi:hypothetical protein
MNVVILGTVIRLPLPSQRAAVAATRLPAVSVSQDDATRGSRLPETLQRAARASDLLQVRLGTSDAIH